MDLPFEVLVYLFKYLPHGDRTAAGLTCRRWHEASCDQSFQNRQQICFTKNIRKESYVTDIYNSQKYNKFRSFAFKEIDLVKELAEFWRTNGGYIRCLNFDECEMHEKMFISILNYCPGLESLSISNCRELFMTASFTEDEFKNARVDKLTALRSLNLSKNRYLSDALFGRLTASTRNLEELDLSWCPITFHSVVHKRFYPREHDVFQNPSESIFTFLFIYEYLKLHQHSLRALKLNNTLLDSEALQLISTLPDLQLKCLEAFGCDQLSIKGISSLVSTQKHLVELNLGKCSRITDEVLADICENLTNLKKLNVSECNKITDGGIIHLKNLTRLQSINISQCCLLTTEAIKSGICHRVNETVLDLNVSSLDLDDTAAILISERLPNLRSLYMNSCFASVNDASVQSIFKNLTYLTTLCIKYCNAVSDAGITGTGLGSQDNSDGYVIHNHLPNNYQTVSLRSRAEEEIVRDAKQKRDVRELCERLDAGEHPKYSLSRLKSLQHLDVSGCNRITDVSLMFAFDHRDLKSLYLSNCQQVTHEGLHRLALSCHSLETLDLSECYNTRDGGVKEIVKNLHRLKNLNLSGCNLLTDESLDHIQNNCKVLKTLDVRRCPNLSVDRINMLYTLPTLHTIQLSKTDMLLSDQTKGKKIKPPTPPRMHFFRKLF